jgi:hypothetical protein
MSYFTPAIDVVLTTDPAQLSAKPACDRPKPPRQQTAERRYRRERRGPTDGGESAMGEIVDFRSRRTEILRRKADKYSELSNHYAARVDWLQQNGAPLVEQVRASLDASKAHGAFRQIEQTLLRDGAVGGLCS